MCSGGSVIALLRYLLYLFVDLDFEAWQRREGLNAPGSPRRRWTHCPTGMGGAGEGNSLSRLHPSFVTPAGCAAP
jgi:hypothetical protein